MISVLNLDREQRIKEIISNLLSKDSMSSTFSTFTKLDDISEIFLIIQSIEDRIYYISESPSFEFNGRNYATRTYNCYSIDDFKSLMDNNPNDFFIIYSLQISPMVFTNPYVPYPLLERLNSVSKPQSYHLRGCFVNDPSTMRNKIINKILDEE
jgi:hypothetical protein